MPERNPSSIPAAPRQRWRVAYRRLPDAPALDQRETAAAWEGAVARSGLPFAGTDRSPSTPRIALGAPLPRGVAAECELLDVFLASPVSVAEMRERFVGTIPTGHEIVALHDVWVGAPALQSVVSGATYRVTLAPEPRPPTVDVLRAVAARLLARQTLPRTRAKASGTVTYDLRPLLEGIEVADATFRVTVRIDPERGMGRPEEVVAALSEELGVELAVASVVRERLSTRD